jgi:hypothetical protein
MTTFAHRGYTVRLKRRNMFGGWTATVSDHSVAHSLFLGRQSRSKAIGRVKLFVDLLVDQQVIPGCDLDGLKDETTRPDQLR